MKLKHLLRKIQGIEVRGSKEIDISGICADSRTVSPGNLFIARKGIQYDGNQFIQKAVDAGAAAIVTDFYDPFLKKTQIICSKPEDIEAHLAACYYENPSKKLFVIGVTGSKGKTTSGYLIHHLLEGLDEKCGLVGTVETIIGEHRIESRFTTHDAITNQKLLREMVEKSCKTAVLEISSHGLEQRRVNEITFDIALFTNLYPDHLDYHKTIDAYAISKRKLFDQLNGTAILNADSPWSDFMKGGKKRLTFAIDAAADLRAQNIRCSERGTEFSIDGIQFTSSLMGRFNVYNLLGAIAIGLEREASLSKIAEILAKFKNVPGRLESVPNRRGICVLVDYAHTGEALENALSILREVATKRILVVFGCGGNRDPERRRTMGIAAERNADLSIITNDNPRNEDPEEIAKQILLGFREPEKVLVELDRKKAIHRAIAIAEKGDIVLIAGKGHEKVQIFAHRTVPFDDASIAKEALQNSRSSDILCK